VALCVLLAHSHGAGAVVAAKTITGAKKGQNKCKKKKRGKHGRHAEAAKKKHKHKKCKRKKRPKRRAVT
jgi:hypothetical protein